MKVLFVLLGSLFLFLSCQGGNRSGKEEQEEEIASTPQATAIFWVDKDKDYQNKKKKGPLMIRTVKAEVDIDSSGRVRLLSYTKPQRTNVKSYLQYRLENFRVKEIMLDSGFVKPGVQYVQLRYMPERLEKHCR